ncbi:MAG TPA: zf-HC2 domain-containing protein [Trebonia sp.]|nr:zf-HC2 domain-containing protein [Trebonia sp.]
MTSDHDLHLLTGTYALDALDADERARFERHMAGCDACQGEVRGLRETAARLAAATAIAPPPGMRRQVLAAAARTRQLPPASRTHGAYRTAGRRFSRPWPAVVIAVTAAAAVIVALLVLQVTTRDQHGGGHAGPERRPRLPALGHHPYRGPFRRAAARAGPARPRQRAEHRGPPWHYHRTRRGTTRTTTTPIVLIPARA